MNIKSTYCSGIFMLLWLATFSQRVGIGTNAPHASAQLEITSTSKGLLIPRMNAAGISAIANPARGLMVYDSVNNQLMVNMGSPAVPDWQTIAFKSGWGLAGNSGTNAANNFIGTLDNVPLRFRQNNQPAGRIDPYAVGGNTGFGSKTLSSLSSGTYNTAFGMEALIAVTSGGYNVAIGNFALDANTTGNFNTATGYGALSTNIAGTYNVAVGMGALFGNLASYNVAIGGDALSLNNTGTENTATGYRSLYTNRGGSSNTANGTFSLYSTNGGGQNTAAGYRALYSNTTASQNSAFGSSALHANTTGTPNTAVGGFALFNNTTGGQNVALGANSMYWNVAGSYNTALGSSAGNNNGTNPSNFTAIGYNAGRVGSNSNTIEIGNTSVGWIGGNVGWSTYFSDARAKTDAQDNVPGLSFIIKLRPVTYRLNLQKQHDILGINNLTEWDGKYDIEKKVQTGFIAQEVEQAARELNFDFNGVSPPVGNRKLYSMQYAAFVVPLVKAVQEQQAIISDLQKEVAELKRLIGQAKH